MCSRTHGASSFCLTWKMGHRAHPPQPEDREGKSCSLTHGASSFCLTWKMGHRAHPPQLEDREGESCSSKWASSFSLTRKTLSLLPSDWGETGKVATWHRGPQVSVLCERWDTEPTTLTLRTERGKLQPECGPQPPNCSIQPGVQTISFPLVWLPASFTKSLLYSVQQLWFNGYCLVTLAPSFTPLPHPSDGQIFQGTQMWPFWKLLLHHSTSRAQSQGSPPAIP